jgi:hypothetical protein
MKVLIVMLLCLQGALANTKWNVEYTCLKVGVIDCGWVHALAQVESRSNLQQKVTVDSNGVGHYGMMQIQCATARAMGMVGPCTQLLDPMVALQYSVSYYQYQLDRYHGNVERAVSAYNAGTATTKNQQYVQLVRSNYLWQRKKNPQQGPHCLPLCKKLDGLESYLIDTKSGSPISLAAIVVLHSA